MKKVSFVSLFLALVFPISVIAAAAQPPSASQRLHMKLAPPVSYDSGGPITSSVAVADLNGDGKPDLVVVNNCQSINKYGYCVGNGEVAVLLGIGDGTFQPAVVYSTGAYGADSVAIGDLRGKGVLDLVVANMCLDQNCQQDGAVSVLLGNGDGTFQPAVIYGSGSTYTWAVALGDLNGDGNLDLALINTYFGGIEYEGSVSVLLGNGNGTFQSAVGYGTGGRYPGSVAIGDLRGNGISDLAVAEFSGGSGNDGGAGVLLGNGDGTFQPVVTYDSGGEFARSVAVGVLRGNGVLDVVVSNEWSSNEGSEDLRGELGVLLGNSNGTFQPPVGSLAHGVGAPSYPAIGLGSNSVVIGDVNGDSIPDVILVELCQKLKGEACIGDGQVNVLLGHGDGTFQSPIVYSSGGYGGSGVAVADVNGDGRPDVIAVSEQVSPSNYEGTIAVFLNETTYTTKTTLASSPNPSQVNQPVTFTATITSTPAVPNGELVTFYNGKTEIGTGTTTNTVATLTTSFSAAKTYTIKATYPGDPFRKASSGTVKQVVNH